MEKIDFGKFIKDYDDEFEGLYFLAENIKFVNINGVENFMYRKYLNNKNKPLKFYTNRNFRKFLYDFLIDYIRQSTNLVSYPSLNIEILKSYKILNEDALILLLNAIQIRVESDRDNLITLIRETLHNSEIYEKSSEEERKKYDELYEIFKTEIKKNSDLKFENERQQIEIKYSKDENRNTFNIAMTQIEVDNSKYDLLFSIYDWFVETYIKNDYHIKKSKINKKTVFSRRLSEVIEDETGKLIQPETIRKGYNRYLKEQKDKK